MDVSERVSSLSCFESGNCPDVSEAIFGGMAGGGLYAGFEGGSCGGDGADL